MGILRNKERTKGRSLTLGTQTNEEASKYTPEL